MPRKVYEGEAALDISKWLSGLDQLETKTSETADKLVKIFEGLDASIGATMTRINTSFKSLSSEMTAIAAAVKQANSALNGGATPSSQAGAQAAADKQALADAANARRAAQTAEQLDNRNRLAALKDNADNEIRLIKDKYTAERGMFGVARADEQNQLLAQLSERRAAIEKSIREEQALRAVALTKAAELQRAKAAGGTAADGTLFTVDAYKAATAAAEESAQRQRVLLAELAQVEASTTQGIKTNISTIKTEAKAAASDVEASIKNGFLASLSASLEKARLDLKQVEDQWNSIFRAGSQVSSLGQQLNQFTKSALTMGEGLLTNAGDLDFWARRTIAAMKSAGGAMDDGAHKTTITLDALKQATFEIGREVGAVDPKAIAEGWYFYQSALGSTITTTEQLQQAQINVNAAMKSSVATNTQVETVIRGVTSALGEFGMAENQFSYALAVMQNVTQTTQAELGDMLTAFTKVGPQAKQLGMDIGDVSTIFSLLAQEGIRGSTAGRLLSGSLQSMVAPTHATKEAFKELFTASRGFTEHWEKYVYTAGGNLQFFDTFNQKGELLSKGVLHNLALATEHMTAVEQASFVGRIFGAERTRVMTVLLEEYRAAMEKAGGSTNQEANAVEALNKALHDPAQQLQAFGDQWQEVAGSIKVRMGQISNSYSELKDRIATILLTDLTPVLEKVDSLIRSFLEWSKANPEVADGLVKVALAVVAITAVLGPLLAGIGFAVQGIAGLAVASKTISVIFTVLRAAAAGGAISWKVALAAMSGDMTAFATATQAGAAAAQTSVLGLSVPLLAIAAVLVALALAWRYNWFGIRDNLKEAAGEIGTVLLTLAGTLTGIGTILTGVFNGDDNLVKRGAEQVLQQLFAVGYELEQMKENFTVWGSNLMVALANGIYNGAVYVRDAAVNIASEIAAFFKSYSPPKVGPLKDIAVWGRNLMLALVDGMKSTDFNVINDIAGKIGEAIKRNVDAGLNDPSGYANSVGLGGTLVSQMLATLKEGGTVNEDFFAKLRPSLKEWYDYVVNIATSYQEVYKQQQALDAETERLNLLKAQTAELEKQNTARQTAFDNYLGQQDGTGVVNNANAMVDPTSPEGQRKIAEMRASLGKEDFANWIAFQKKLWQQKSDLETTNLKTQADVVQAQIDSTKEQLAAAQEQYDIYVKIYEYAVKMYNLSEEQKKLEEEKAKKDAQLGDQAAMAAYLKEIAAKIGGDKAIKDEQQLLNARGGDNLAAVGDAGKQKEAEAERLATLEALNRKKRAEFDVALINATSKEQQDAIKAQQAAWNAAYQSEKTRLAERVANAEAVLQAEQDLADKSSYGRIVAQEVVFQKQILDLLKGQVGPVEDANALKAKSATLAAAEATAKDQLTGAERSLQDLQEYGNAKRLEFEDRIKAAGKDPEKLARIKEEQAAWELAYKEAYNAEQARVNAARRAEQDLADQLAALKKKKDGPLDFGTVGADPVGADPLAGLKNLWVAATPSAEQLKFQAEGKQAVDNLKLAIKFLTDESIPAAVKVKLLSDAIKQEFGWKTWEDAIAPEDVRKNMGLFFAGLRGDWDRFSEGFSTSFNSFWVFDVVPKWESAKTLMKTASDGVMGVLIGLTEGITKWWDESVVPFWNRQMAFWTAIFIGEGENSLPNTVKRGLDKVVSFFTGLFSGTDGSLNGAMQKGIKGMLDAWENFWFGENGIITRIGSALTTLGNTIINFFKNLNPFKGSTDPNAKPGGGGGSGWASGLSYVPYNNFSAVLHQGERVLTAAENSMYGSLEKTLKTMAQTLAGAGNGGAVNNTKTVNITIGSVNASNPDEGRALVNQLAFFS